MLSQDFREFIESLNDNGVRYLVVEGYAEDFLQSDTIIQLGYPPNRIDLLTTLTGVDFETSFSARVELDLEGLTVKFIDLENLMKNKKASGRAQDLADLENLE